MKKKKVGIVGLGSISQRHAQSLKQSDHGELSAGVDLDSAKRLAFEEKWQCPAYSSVQEMLAADSLDGVIISTPPAGRLELLRPLLEAGCHVLCEKPLAHTLEKSTAIRDLAQNYPNSRVHLGFCHRFAGAVAKARDVMEKGGIGKTVWIHIVFASNAPHMQNLWFTDPAISGGGVAMDVACHALDLFNFLAGRSLNADGLYRHSWTGRGEDSFTLALRSEDGALGSILGSYLASTPRMTWEICGEEATLRYDYSGPLQLISSNGKSEFFEVEPAPKRFLAQCNAWVASMDGQTTNLATLDDGHFIASVIDSLTERNAPKTVRTYSV